MDIPRPSSGELAWYTEGAKSERKAIIEFLETKLETMTEESGLKPKILVARITDEIEAGKHLEGI
jgi:hypothetical protein